MVTTSSAPTATMSSRKQDLYYLLLDARYAGNLARCGDDPSVLEFLKYDYGVRTRPSEFPNANGELNDLMLKAKFSGLIDSAANFKGYDLAYFDAKVIPALNKLSDSEVEAVLTSIDLLVGTDDVRQEDSYLKKFRDTYAEPSKHLVNSLKAGIGFKDVEVPEKIINSEGKEVETGRTRTVLKATKGMQRSTVQGIIEDNLNLYGKGHPTDRIPFLRRFSVIVASWLADLNGFITDVDRWLFYHGNLGPLTWFRAVANFVKKLIPGSPTQKCFSEAIKGEEKVSKNKPELIAMGRVLHAEGLQHLSADGNMVLGAFMDYAGISTSSLQNFEFDTLNKQEVETFARFNQIKEINPGLHRAWMRQFADERRTGLSSCLNNLRSLDRDQYATYAVASYLYVPELNKSWRELLKIAASLSGNATKEMQQILDVCATIRERNGPIASAIGVGAMGNFLSTAVLATQINPMRRQGPDQVRLAKNAMNNAGDTRWFKPNNLAMSIMVGTENQENHFSTRNSILRQNRFFRGLFGFIQGIFPWLPLGAQAASQRQVEFGEIQTTLNSLNSYRQLVLQAQNPRNYSTSTLEDAFYDISIMGNMLTGMSLGGYVNMPLFETLKRNAARFREQGLNIPDDATPEVLVKAFSDHFRKFREEFRLKSFYQEKPMLTLNSTNPMTDAQRNPSAPVAVTVDMKFSDFTAAKKVYILEPDYLQLQQLVDNGTKYDTAWKESYKKRYYLEQLAKDGITLESWSAGGGSGSADDFYNAHVTHCKKTYKEPDDSFDTFLIENDCFLHEKGVEATNPAMIQTIMADKKSAHCPSIRVVTPTMMNDLFKALEALNPELTKDQTCPFINTKNNPPQGLHKLIPAVAHPYGRAHDAGGLSTENNAWGPSIRDFHELCGQYVAYTLYEGPRVFWDCTNPPGTPAFDPTKANESTLCYIDAEYYYKTRKAWVKKNIDSKELELCGVRAPQKVIDAYKNNTITLAEETAFAQSISEAAWLRIDQKILHDMPWAANHRLGTAEMLKKDLEARQQFGSGTLEHRNIYRKLKTTYTSTAAAVEHIVSKLDHLSQALAHNAKLAGCRGENVETFSLDTRRFADMIPVVGHVVDWILSVFDTQLYKLLPRPSAPAPYSDTDYGPYGLSTIKQASVPVGPPATAHNADGTPQQKLENRERGAKAFQKIYDEHALWGGMKKYTPQGTSPLFIETSNPYAQASAHAAMTGAVMPFIHNMARTH